VTHPLSSPDEERWAEALAIERIHGDGAYDWVIERIGQLAFDGDDVGVARFMAIIDRLDMLREPGARQ
jgi:hypothetical protein